MRRTNNDTVKRIALELSLKPFGRDDGRTYEQCAYKVLTAWRPLLEAAEEISFMLWVADGSEILEWSGNLDQPLEWARYIGFCNSSFQVYDARHHKPDRNAILFADNLRELQYRDLKSIVKTLRLLAADIYSKPVTIGATFDPGPEFAESPFKYSKHPEIIVPPRLSGRPTFPMVDAGAYLHADSDKYATYPEGIPEGESFARFLGRQISAYCRDIGFDYIWLSNGFGFSAVAWDYLGPGFDGENYYPAERAQRLQQFKRAWDDLYQANPNFPMEVRGSNFAAGMDIAKDGVDFRWLYDSGYIRLPPPNSPWGALNFDFGLEIAGFLSRIVRSPKGVYLFRYYPNDPWFWQNPWTDTFYGEPYDIYLPLSTGVINNKGEVLTPSVINILTGDTEFGETDPLTAVQVASHIRTALNNRPDDVGLVTWIYPFDAYHDLASTGADGQAEVFFGDWFVRSLINNGLPVSTVSTISAFNAYLDSRDETPSTVILMATAAAGTAQSAQHLFTWLSMGIPVFLYGPATSLHKDILDVLDITLTEPLDGEFRLVQSGCPEADATLIFHDSVGSAGGLASQCRGNSSFGPVKQLYHASSAAGERSYCHQVSVNGTELFWLRGTNLFDTRPATSHLALKPGIRHPQYFDPGRLGAVILARLGYFIDVRCEAEQNDALLLFSRHDNAWYLNGYAVSPVGHVNLKFVDGAPVFHATHTKLTNGASNYPLARTIRYECRIFVQQNEGIIGCDTRARDEHHKELSLHITGLEDASVTFLPPKGFPVTFEYDNRKTYFDAGKSNITMDNLSGHVWIRW
jgi:hypothetical protein